MATNFVKQFRKSKTMQPYVHKYDWAAPGKLEENPAVYQIEWLEEQMDEHFKDNNLEYPIFSVSKCPQSSQVSHSIFKISCQTCKYAQSCHKN